MRYSMLLLLEIIQVRELKPVEVDGNLRYQQRGFQPSFFSPMVGTRPGVCRWCDSLQRAIAELLRDEENQKIEEKFSL